jgi:hypothetical protein
MYPTNGTGARPPSSMTLRPLRGGGDGICVGVGDRGVRSGFIAVEMPGPAAWIAGLSQKAAIGFPNLIAPHI